jgi:hypothetical protein
VRLEPGNGSIASMLTLTLLHVCMSRWTAQGNCIFLRRDDGHKICASGALWDWPERGENKICRKH